MALDRTHEYGFSLLAKLRHRVYQWLRTKAQEVRDVRGFRVVVENTRFDVGTDAVIARLGDALELIERRGIQHSTENMAEAMRRQRKIDQQVY